MTMLNRRNAMIGWAVWKLGKRAIKRKARGAVPAIDAETKRPNKPAFAAAAAAAAATGALVFWRRSRGGGDGGGDE
jgi:hypothetical protein